MYPAPLLRFLPLLWLRYSDVAAACSQASGVWPHIARLLSVKHRCGWPGQRAAKITELAGEMFYTPAEVATGLQTGCSSIRTVSSLAPHRREGRRRQQRHAADP